MENGSELVFTWYTELYGGGPCKEKNVHVHGICQTIQDEFSMGNEFSSKKFSSLNHCRSHITTVVTQGPETTEGRHEW